MAEQRAVNSKVPGSSPGGGANSSLLLEWECPLDY